MVNSLHIPIGVAHICDRVHVMCDRSDMTLLNRLHLLPDAAQISVTEAFLSATFGPTSFELHAAGMDIHLHDEDFHTTGRYPGYWTDHLMAFQTAWGVTIRFFMDGFSAQWGVGYPIPLAQLRRITLGITMRYTFFLALPARHIWGLPHADRTDIFERYLARASDMTTVHILEEYRGYYVYPMLREPGGIPAEIEPDTI